MIVWNPANKSDTSARPIASATKSSKSGGLGTSPAVSRTAHACSCCANWGPAMSVGVRQARVQAALIAGVVGVETTWKGDSP
jgi:hypothetical protein